MFSTPRRSSVLLETTTEEDEEDTEAERRPHTAPSGDDASSEDLEAKRVAATAAVDALINAQMQGDDDSSSLYSFCA